MKHVLELDSLYLEYGLHKVLQDVFMKCETGSVVGLLGRNGCGKSSLMKIVFGSLKAYSKCIRIDGVNLLETNINKQEIAFLPQHSIVPSFLKIEEVFKLFQVSIQEFNQAFPDVKWKSTQRVNVLSTGEKRILEIFCILKTTGKFAVLDEPFSYLSPIANERLIALLNQVKLEKGIIITDHAYRYVLEASDQQYLLRNGKTYLIKDLNQLIEFEYLLNI